METSSSEKLLGEDFFIHTKIFSQMKEYCKKIINDSPFALNQEEYSALVVDPNGVWHRRVVTDQDPLFHPLMDEGEVGVLYINDLFLYIVFMLLKREGYVPEEMEKDFSRLLPSPIDIDRFYDRHAQSFGFEDRHAFEVQCRDGG